MIQCRKTAILHALLKNHNDVVELFLKHGNGINQYDTVRIFFSISTILCMFVAMYGGY